MFSLGESTTDAEPKLCTASSHLPSTPHRTPPAPGQKQGTMGTTEITGIISPTKKKDVAENEKNKKAHFHDMAEQNDMVMMK